MVTVSSSHLMIELNSLYGLFPDMISSSCKIINTAIMIHFSFDVTADKRYTSVNFT